MYLYLLNNRERENFLELATFAMDLDGVRKKEEENILFDYKNECQLIDYIVYKQNEIDKVIIELRSSLKKIKKIILLELTGIFISDTDLTDEESKFLEKLSNEFNIKEYELKRIIRWVEAMNDIVKEGYEIISK